MPGDIVAFSPPLVITEAEIDEMMRCFAKRSTTRGRW
jgi:adenosylmethionine-8-amino-7-oxononanoate aminotransferase